MVRALTLDHAILGFFRLPLNGIKDWRMERKIVKQRHAARFFFCSNPKHCCHFC